MITYLIKVILTLLIFFVIAYVIWYLPVKWYIYYQNKKKDETV